MSEPVDVAALVRQPAGLAPLRSWQLGHSMRSLWRLFSARRLALLGGLLAASLRAGVLVLASIAVGRVVHGGDVWMWAGVSALGLIMAAAIGYAGQRWVVAAVHDGLTGLRERLVERQLGLPVEIVQNEGAEAFVLAMTRDCELLGQMARACFSALFPGAVLVLLCLGGIAALLPTLFLPLLLVLLAVWLARKRFAWRLAAQMGLTHEAIDRLYAQLGGSVLRHELTVSHANEAPEREACRASIAQAHARASELAVTQAGVAEADALILGLALLGLLAWMAVGGVAVEGSSMGSALFLVLALRSALQRVLGALQELALGVPALASVHRLLAMPAAPEHQGTVLPTHWRVTLQGVSRHAGSRELMHGVDLSLEPGRIIVLTGENGSGKTTLLRLLLGLAELDAGIMRVDGVPFAQIDRAAFRRGVGYLPQNPVLFAGTVRDNIAYAVPDATPQGLEQVARAVGVGVALTTRLGHGGSPLSGGERQRIGLARALLRHPRMLVLDEPTNHLDALSAAGLMSLLRRMPVPPVVLVVSHDPAVIAQADEVLELRCGQVTVASAVPSTSPAMSPGR